MSSSYAMVHRQIKAILESEVGYTHFVHPVDCDPLDVWCALSAQALGGRRYQMINWPDVDEIGFLRLPDECGGL